MNELSSYMRKDELGNIYYQDDESRCYKNLTLFLHCYVLGFCGSGIPEQIIKFIYDLIILQEDWSYTNINYKDHKEKRQKYLMDNIELIECFFDYFLHKKKLTQHGENMSGWWVTDKNFLEAIKTWHKEYMSEREN